jgi:hypothetical protein
VWSVNHRGTAGSLLNTQPVPVEGETIMTLPLSVSRNNPSAITLRTVADARLRA